MAVRDPNLPGIHLYSDSQTSAASHKYISDTKWTEFKDFYIGIAGDTITKTLIREYIKPFLDEQVVTSRKDVIEIYKKIEATIKEEFQYKHTETISRNYMDFDIILVTKKGKIYTCGEFLCASEEPLFATSWTWSLFAKGTLTFLYEREMIRTDTLSHIMDITYQLTTDCGGPTNYIYLPIIQNEQPIV